MLLSRLPRNSTIPSFGFLPTETVLGKSVADALVPILRRSVGRFLSLFERHALGRVVNDERHVPAFVQLIPFVIDNPCVDVVIAFLPRLVFAKKGIGRRVSPPCQELVVHCAYWRQPGNQADRYLSFFTSSSFFPRALSAEKTTDCHGKYDCRNDRRFTIKLLMPYNHDNILLQCPLDLCF